MERCVGQHHAEVRIPGSDKSKIAFGPLSEQHDRPLRAEQQLALLWRDLT